MYEGTLVRLRAPRPEDAEKCVEWLNDLETMYLANGGAPRPRFMEEELEWFKKPEEGCFSVETLDGRYIGCCNTFGVSAQGRSCMIGLLIGEKDARGKGYGTDMIRTMLKYLFHERNMARVALDVFAYNESARRLYEKLGFVREGVLREQEYAMGRWWDVFFYGMLRREYDAIYGH